MRRFFTALTGVAGIAVLTAACGGGSTPSSASLAASTPAASPTAPSSSAAAGAAGNATISLQAIPGIPGKALVDKQDRTLYLFEADKVGKSACTGACAAAWPPLTVTGTLSAGPGVNVALLSTIPTPGGRFQVVYDGHPLYYFSGDSHAGDDKGQGVKAFGAGWYVVAASGSKIDTS